MELFLHQADHIAFRPLLAGFICHAMAEPFLLCKVFIVDFYSEVFLFVSKILTLCSLIQYLISTFRKKITPTPHLLSIYDCSFPLCQLSWSYSYRARWFGKMIWQKEKYQKCYGTSMEQHAPVSLSKISQKSAYLLCQRDFLSISSSFSCSIISWQHNQGVSCGSTGPDLSAWCILKILATVEMSYS